MEWLKGYKTYIVVVLGVIVNGCIAMGYIDASLLPTINSVLVFLGLGAIRAGIAKK